MRKVEYSICKGCQYMANLAGKQDWTLCTYKPIILANACYLVGRIFDFIGRL